MFSIKKCVFYIIRKGIDYNTWMIEKIKTAKKLKKMYTKKQIITIYESGI